MRVDLVQNSLVRLVPRRCLATSVGRDQRVGGAVLPNPRIQVFDLFATHTQNGCKGFGAHSRPLLFGVREVVIGREGSDLATTVEDHSLALVHHLLQIDEAAHERLTSDSVKCVEAHTDRVAATAANGVVTAQPTTTRRLFAHRFGRSVVPLPLGWVGFAALGHRQVLVDQFVLHPTEAVFAGSVVVELVGQCFGYHRELGICSAPAPGLNRFERRRCADGAELCRIRLADRGRSRLIESYCGLVVKLKCHGVAARPL